MEVLAARVGPQTSGKQDQRQTNSRLVLPSPRFE